MTSVPVSVMAADVEHESLWVILKIISAKTKALAACEDFLEMRGIYRSGLLGKGVAGILDLHDPGVSVRKRWLILTKGVGFAPAVNLIRWAAGRIDIHVIADPEKVGDDVIRQQFRAWQPEAFRNEGGRFWSFSRWRSCCSNPRQLRLCSNPTRLPLLHLPLPCTRPARTPLI